MKAKVRTFSGTTSNEVTQREIDNRALARKAAAEGFVLLKNEGSFSSGAKRWKDCTVWCGSSQNHQGRYRFRGCQ